MSKEKIEEKAAIGETGIELISITADTSSSSKLIERIQKERKTNSKSLILVRTPLAHNLEIAGKQVEALFEAGANAHRNLIPEDKE